MKPILTFFFFCLLAIPMLGFAIENRARVQFDLNPFDFFAQTASATIALPLAAALAAVFLVGLFFGFILGRFRP